MRRALPLAFAAMLAAVPAAAQDSVFGIRGLGFLDRAGSARSVGEGGGFALFDGASSLNPAALAAWRGTAGWAVASGTSHSFDAGSGPTTLTATRFPLVGFAGQIGPRWVLGVAVTDYLDRNWAVAQTDTVVQRGAPVPVQDETKSVGGVSDVRVAVAYRMAALTVGLGLHALTGNTLTTVQRTFPSDSAYVPFTLNQTTTYRGVGMSVGFLAHPLGTLVLGGSARFNGRLRTSAPDSVIEVGMPVELNGGASLQPVTGLQISGTVGYASWSAAADALAAAGQERSRNVWAAGVGVEVSALHFGAGPMGLRAGYRWRQLPFPVDSVTLTEHALAFGLGFDTAGGRATVDAALEFGSRAAGAVSERFTTAYVGLTIRP